MDLLNSLRFSFHLIFHPFDGFWDLKHEKRGNIKSASIIIALLCITYALKAQYTGFIFNNNNLRYLNILLEIGGILFLVFLWSVANWCLTTLMDGEGSFRDIIITTAYAMVPLVLINLPLIVLSNVIIKPEEAFYKFFSTLAVVWAMGLLFFGTMIVHQYTPGKTVFTVFLILIGMGVIVFLGLLFFNLIQQMIGFVVAIYREITFRM